MFVSAHAAWHEGWIAYSLYQPLPPLPGPLAWQRRFCDNGSSLQTHLIEMHRRKVLSFFAVFSLANASSPALLAGIPSKKAVYRGGTLSEPAPETTGTVNTAERDHFVFQYRSGIFRIPYQRINSLEYGQKAGRRLGLAIAFTPALLLSKKRKHYLTISFLDEEGGQQAVVFELGKKIVRITLAGLEARTGLAIDYQGEASREATDR